MKWKMQDDSHFRTIEGVKGNMEDRDTIKLPNFLLNPNEKDNQ